MNYMSLVKKRDVFKMNQIKSNQAMVAKDKDSQMGVYQSLLGSYPIMITTALGELWLKTAV